MTGAESLPVLKSAAELLGTDVADDYWLPTEGNARAALLQLIALASMRPDGVWQGEVLEDAHGTSGRVVESPSMFTDAIARLTRNLEQARRGVRELTALATQEGSQPERMACISLAALALEAAASAVNSLHVWQGD